MSAWYRYRETIILCCWVGLYLLMMTELLAPAQVGELGEA